jgi:hypothetical protein
MSVLEKGVMRKKIECEREDGTNTEIYTVFS